MNDDADVANDLMQHMIDMGVKNATDKIKKPSNQTGKCIWYAYRDWKQFPSHDILAQNKSVTY